MGLLQEWGPPGGLSPSCYLRSRLPALSTLRKAKGGDKVAEVLMGHVTPRFLQLQRQPHPPRGLAKWNAEKKSQVMDRVSVRDRFLCQSQELQAETCPTSTATSPSVASCVSPTLAPHPPKDSHTLSASWGPTALSAEMPSVGRATQMPPTELIRPIGQKQSSLLWTLPLRPAGITGALKGKPLGTKDSPPSSAQSTGHPASEHPGHKHALETPV